MVRKTKEDAQETRNCLLDAAEKLFSEQGVARTALSDIASAAGVTRGAVYWHFANKADLLAALWARAALPMEEAFAAVEEAHAGDPLRRIREKSLTVLRRAEHDPAARALLTIMFIKCEWVEELDEARKNLLLERDCCLGRVAADFTSAIEAGQLPAGLNVEACAFGLFSLIDGLTLHWLFDPQRFGLNAHASTLVDAYLNGLRIARS